MTEWRERREDERRAAEKALARDAGVGWVEFLTAHSWQSMVTHTFPDHVGPEVAANVYARWCRHVDKLTGLRLRWARATEYQRRGVVHFHSLIAGWLPDYDRWSADEVTARRTELEELWRDVGGGFSRIDVYTPARAIYCTKYVAKGGDMDLGGAWGCAPTWAQPRLRLR